jgi:hypothetical protein
MSDMHCGRLHVRPALVLRGFFVILQMHVQTNLDRQRGSCCYGKDGPRERGRVQGSGDEDGVKGTTLERMGRYDADSSSMVSRRRLNNIS